MLAEAFRVLRPGGRFAVADVVLLRDLAPQWVRVAGLWTGCVVGALTVTDYRDKLVSAGFAAPDVQITRRYDRDELAELAEPLRDELPAGRTVADAVDALDGALASASIRAVKPLGQTPR